MYTYQISLFIETKRQLSTYTVYCKTSSYNNLRRPLHVGRYGTQEQDYLQSETVRVSVNLTISLLAFNSELVKDIKQLYRSTMYKENNIKIRSLTSLMNR